MLTCPGTIRRTQLVISVFVIYKISNAVFQHLHMNSTSYDLLYFHPTPNSLIWKIRIYVHSFKQWNPYTIKAHLPWKEPLAQTRTHHSLCSQCSVDEESGGITWQNVSVTLGNTLQPCHIKQMMSLGHHCMYCTCKIIKWLHKFQLTLYNVTLFSCFILEILRYFDKC